MRRREPGAEVPNVAQGVRMPRTLQRDVAAIAEAHGESFNAAVCRLLEAGVRLQQQGAPLHLLGADLPAMAAEAAAEAVQAVVASAVEDAVRKVAADFGHLHDASTRWLQQAQWRAATLAADVEAGAAPERLREHAVTLQGVVSAALAVEAERAPPGHIEPEWQPPAARRSAEDRDAEFARRKAQWEADKLAHDVAAGAPPERRAEETDAEFARRKGLWEVEDAARRIARAEADRRAQHPDDDVPTPPGVPDRYMAEGKAQDGRRKGQRRKADAP